MCSGTNNPATDIAEKLCVRVCLGKWACLSLDTPLRTVKEPGLATMKAQIIITRSVAGKRVSREDWLKNVIYVSSFV